MFDAEHNYGQEKERITIVKTVVGASDEDVGVETPSFVIYLIDAAKEVVAVWDDLRGQPVIPPEMDSVLCDLANALDDLSNTRERTSAKLKTG